MSYSCYWNVCKPVKVIMKFDSHTGHPLSGRHYVWPTNNFAYLLWQVSYFSCGHQVSGIINHRLSGWRPIFSVPSPILDFLRTILYCISSKKSDFHQTRKLTLWTTNLNASGSWQMKCWNLFHLALFYLNVRSLS